METASIYKGEDPRELPLYSVYEAARYLKIPRSTLRSWVAGRTYEVKEGEAYFDPLITLADPDSLTLSFNNLIEVYVLSALRVKHQVKINAIRTAIAYAEKEMDVKRLLLRDELRTGAGDLFWDKYGDLINLSQAGQLVLRDLFRAHLERVERDEVNMPIQLRPFIAPHHESRSVVIDPRISFGRPVVQGITTAILAQRADAGESIQALADDYALDESKVKDAILYEMAA